MFVELPSKGQFYPPGHPLHGEETVEIRFMTAKDEDTLTSPTLIKKGIVLNRLIQNLLLDPSIKAHDLLLGDKNAILVEARISGYGPLYESKITCPSCSEEMELEFDLDECKQVHHGFEEGQEGVKMLDNGNFLVTLSQTGVECEFRLLNGHDEKILLKDLAPGNKNKKEKSNLTQQLKLMMVSLNGHTEPQWINHYAECMPIRDSRALRKYYEQVNPTTNLITNFECENCNHTEDMEVPLSIGFFWPKQ
jgi:hypothetical protein